jgi:Glycosyl transferases group 1/Domain of unknown function (DUF4277)
MVAMILNGLGFSNRQLNLVPQYFANEPVEKMGIQAELVVSGCTFPDKFSHERMKVIPFLDKNDEKQREELNTLFVMSDFLLLLTRNDCTPIVFCEANAFDLPVITTNTGGVSGVIQGGSNGFLLPLSARGVEYAALIAEVYSDDQCYARLVQSSRAAFDDGLNWDAWGSSIQKFLNEMLPTIHNRYGEYVAMNILKAARSTTRASLNFSSQTYRVMTSGLRLMPDFLFSGGERCDTHFLI